MTIPFNYKLDEYIKPTENVDDINDTKNDTKNDTNDTKEGTDSRHSLEDVSDEDKLILAIEENPNITISEMMAIVKKSRSTVMRVLSKSKRIVRVGPNVGGRWEIKK